MNGVRSLTGNAWIGLAFRLILAAVLIYAGVIKAFEPDGARNAILAYRLFDADIASVLGWALPIGEIIVGLLLLVGLFVRWAGLAAALLMAGFIIGIASVWMRGYNIDCGCFGGGGDITGEGKNWRYTSEILRDLLFTGMGVWLVAWPVTALGLERASVEANLQGALADGEATDKASDVNETNTNQGERQHG
ncbi:MAG: MauE/DoxX family redox-associated membrane protein [Candidatus Nanopelagicales bacterium]